MASTYGKYPQLTKKNSIFGKVIQGKFLRYKSLMLLNVRKDCETELAQFLAALHECTMVS